MTRKQEIEAGLDRSLQEQVSVRTLDAGFNAAVWARIAAQESPAVAPRRASDASRWLLVSNILGIATSAALVVYFVASGFSGMEVEMNLPLPEISARQTDSILISLGWGITAAAVGMGFAFTRLGRRVRSVLRNEFA
jgi:hypothetical protein